jgi:hypothetical protein
MGLKKKRQQGFLGKDGKWVLSEREKRIARSQLRALKESVAKGGPDDRVMSPNARFVRRKESHMPRRRPRLTEAQRRADLKYLRDSAISAIQKFAETYHGKKEYGFENALDTTGTFMEAYDRAQGKTKTMEVRVMTVRHTSGCEKKFSMALPGSHRLVSCEDAGDGGITRVLAKCPHCGEKMPVRLPEGMAAVPVDGGGADSPPGSGMASDRRPDRGDTGDDSQDDNLRDGDEDEDEEESEGDEDEEEGDRGLLPDEDLPRSGPYRPGSGSRDSLKGYYADHPSRLVRLAKKESNPRLRAAAQVFLDMLRESRSQSGGWPV